MISDHQPAWMIWCCVQPGVCLLCLQERAAALKDVVQRLGSKSALGDMVGTWVGRAAPTLVTPAQLRAVLQACGDAGADADGEVLHMLERLGKVRCCHMPVLMPLTA